MKYYIFDLDGTLANIDHRRHYVTNGNHHWDSFYQACVDDTPNTSVVRLYKQLFISSLHPLTMMPTVEFLIYSGRSESVRDKTKLWLNKNKIIYDELKMRPIGNSQPDQDLKRDWLHASGYSKKIIAVFDDRQKVVDMWRSEGICCCQVAPGNF